MTTLAHQTTRHVADQWESFYESAVFSGIAGDIEHRRRNSYHNSIQDNPNPTGFSNNRPDDAAPPGIWPRNLAAAIDMSMNTADMVLCTERLWIVWNDTTDPRRVYLNAFNGWSGSGDAKRYDFVSQGISVTTSDHKWHVHLEIRRRWVTSMLAAMAIISILKGETKEQFLAAEEGDDMFCQYGETNGKVQAMQFQLLQLDPNCLPRFGPDSGYGEETRLALMSLGFSNSTSNPEGKFYGPFEWALMQKKCAEEAASGGSTIEWPLKATINIPSTTITTSSYSIDVDVVERE